MKKLDLATLGVEEMSDAQMQEVDGGISIFDVYTLVKAYYDFACSYVEFGKNNSDIVSVGANCM